MIDNYVPEQGDIVWFNFKPQLGHEQANTRPALVISPIEYNNPSSLCLVCPITNASKGYPYEVAIPAQQQITGYVLADQIRSVDWNAKRVRFDSKATDDVLTETLLKVETLTAKKKKRVSNLTCFFMHMLVYRLWIINWHDDR